MRAEASRQAHDGHAFLDSDPEPPSEDAVGDVLLRLRAQGVHVEVIRLEGDIVGILAVRPELADVASQLLRLGPDSDLRNCPLDILGLPKRLFGLLDDAGLATVGDILECSREQLLSLHGIGPASVETITNALRDLGLDLTGHGVH
jgi:hypothetical protein